MSKDTSPEQMMIVDLREHAHKLLRVKALGKKFHEGLLKYQQTQKASPDSEESLKEFERASGALHDLMEEILPEGTLSPSSEETKT